MKKEGNNLTLDFIQYNQYGSSPSTGDRVYRLEKRIISDCFLTKSPWANIISLRCS